MTSEDRRAQVAEFQEVINDLRNQVVDASVNPSIQQRPESIDEKKRTLKIRNDNAESDQKLKTITLIILFCFLGIETIAVFFLAFFQGFKAWGFGLEVWNFRLLVAVTISQITAMLVIAVKHLFPNSSRKK